MPMMDFASLRVSYHHTQLTIHICRLAVQGLSWSLIQQLLLLLFISLRAFDALVELSALTIMPARKPPPASCCT